ncbi:MAG: class I mannose-6-phosphate isomerase [Sphingomonas sp.]|nr:class I mannose-6-phosphate isomerase [Sphingomonas sp.]
MAAKRLSTRAVSRPWGRTAFPVEFEHVQTDAPVGEFWFIDTDRDDAQLLVKYLFTSERLSIQVHPDDAAARARGLAHGKDEAWYILDAEPGAVIGLGLTETIPPEALRTAARDGSIEGLIDWRPAKAGDLFWSPAGTIHAIGGGLSLIEVQQNLDLTYRLYDYGRPRELHLDDAVAVADPAPASPPAKPRDLGAERSVLVEGSSFILEKWALASRARLQSDDGELLLMPIAGNGRIDGGQLSPGSVWRVDGEAELDAGNGLELLAAYPGATVVEEICVFI